MPGRTGEIPRADTLKQGIYSLVSHIKAVYEVIKGSRFVLIITSFVILTFSASVLPESFVRDAFLILLWSATIYLIGWYIILALIPTNWLAVGSVPVTGFAEKAADHIAALCGTDSVPFGAVLLLPFAPFSLLTYGQAAICTVFWGFLLTVEILILSSSFSSISSIIYMSKEWFEKKRSNDKSVKDFAEFLYNKYRAYWRVLISLSLVLVLTPRINLLDWVFFIWMPLGLQLTYYIIIYDPEEIDIFAIPNY